MRAVLITGSRGFTDRDALWSILRSELDVEGDPMYPLVVIHGACPSGADMFARRWCTHNRDVASEIAMPALWHVHGSPRAGPIRNGEMVHMLEVLVRGGYTGTVHAFPLGASPGTRGCMKLAEHAGFTVHNHGNRAFWAAQAAAPARNTTPDVMAPGRGGARGDGGEGAGDAVTSCWAYKNGEPACYREAVERVGIRRASRPANGTTRGSVDDVTCPDCCSIINRSQGAPYDEKMVRRLARAKLG